VPRIREKKTPKYIKTKTNLLTFLGIFHMYHSISGTSILQDFQTSKLTLLYITLPILSGILNGLVKLYSVWINKKMLLNALPVHQSKKLLSNEEKFILSLTSVIAIPLIFTVGFFSSFSNREFRLRFLFPLQLTVLSIIFPIFLIAVNPKMKQFAIATFVELFKEKLSVVPVKMRSSKVSPKLSNDVVCHL